MKEEFSGVEWEEVGDQQLLGSGIFFGLVASSKIRHPTAPDAK